MSVTSINGLLLKRMIISGANNLNSKKETVDSLNVFPVPDGDTGTNMSLTVLAAAREVALSHLSFSEDLPRSLKALARLTQLRWRRLPQRPLRLRIRPL